MELMQTLGQTNHLVPLSLLGGYSPWPGGLGGQVRFLKPSIILRAGRIVCRVGESSSKKMDSRHNVIFKVDNQQGLTVQRRELCLMLCGSLEGRGVWGRCVDMDICGCPPVTVTALLIAYTLIQNKFKKKMTQRRSVLIYHCLPAILNNVGDKILFPLICFVA